jgi:hypothetical protein
LFALWFLAVFLSVFWGVFSSVFWDPGKMLVGIGGTGQHAVFRTEHIATNALALDLPTGGPFGLTDEAAAAADFGFGACIVGVVCAKLTVARASAKESRYACDMMRPHSQQQPSS